MVTRNLVKLDSMVPFSNYLLKEKEDEENMTLQHLKKMKGKRWKRSSGTRQCGDTRFSGKLSYGRWVESHCASHVSSNSVCAYLTKPFDHKIELPESVFKSYKQFLKKVHPKIAESLSSHRPCTTEEPEIKVCSGDGAVNFQFMSLWRLLWESPSAVYLFLYLDKKGYTPAECQVIVGALQYSAWGTPTTLINPFLPYKGLLAIAEDPTKLKGERKPYKMDELIKENLKGDLLCQLAKGISLWGFLDDESAMRSVIEQCK